jgi:glutamine amidotransferase
VNSSRKTRLVILDYGMGNLRSVEKALEHVGASAEIGNDTELARSADGLILPGVGAFPKAMQRLRELGLHALLAERLEAGVPVLGICLGLQLLFDSSTELGGAEGLGMMGGEVRELAAGELKVPQIGWSPVRWEQASALTEGIPDGTPFYFVHSFAPHPEPEQLLGSAEYGERFACAAQSGSLFGVQFHPEKSSTAGLRLLANFAGICARVATAA